MAHSWTATELSWPIDLAATVRRYVDTDELAWIDTAASDDSQPRHARFSLVCAKPVAVLEQQSGGPATLAAGGKLLDRDANGWELWRRMHARLPLLPLTPFDLAPGWVGYIGFEMVGQLEHFLARPRDTAPLPRLRLGLFDRGVVLDHRERRAFAVEAGGVRGALGISDDAATDATGTWIDRWEESATARAVFASPRAGRLTADLERGQFERMVARVREYIAAGDVYQVNLAQRFQLDGLPDAFSAYAAIRRTNPEPYSALLRWDDGALASASPELFLSLRDGEVLTRPIKGTRPRTHDPEVDASLVAELLASPKDAAELAMIVDLHRNDLSRVCEPGSVRVLNPRRVEPHPSVFHTVADICGRLAADRDGLDLLAACFPAGSVTGVPKIRALEIIDELEPVTRGAYTGAIGVLSLDGQLNLSVAIRTLQISGSSGSLFVGGGIVAESDPAAEYEETLAKAAGLLRALGYHDGAAGALRGGMGVR